MDIVFRYEEVSQKLKGIFKSRFGVDLDVYEPGILQEELLGKKFGLAARDLVYLFFDIEKEFHMEIPQEDVVEGRFKSFANIVETITKQKNKKGEALCLQKE